MAKEGDLRVWWVPQIPMKAFTIDVDSPKQAAKVLNVLAKYDLFQLENNLKPDYANTGGLNVMENGEWIDWYDEESGEDINGWTAENGF